MKRKNQQEQEVPVPLAQAVAAGEPDRMIDGVPVRTYRGASLSELAPRIRAELGDSAMILRQREGVTGGIAGFFAKRMVEVDVAVLDVPTARSGHIDVADGPSVGPGAPQATVAFDALRAPLPHAAAAPGDGPESPGVGPIPLQPTVPFSAIAEQHGLPGPSAAAGDGTAAAAPEAPAVPTSAPVAPSGPAPGANPYVTTAGTPSGPAPIFTVGVPEPHAPVASNEPPAPPAFDQAPATASFAPPQAFTVGAPSAQETASIEAALAADQARQREARETADQDEAAFDPGRAGADAAPVAQSGASFEDRLRTAGLSSAPATGDPIAALAPLHAALLRRGLPDQIASPVVDDTLLHRVSLQPDRPVAELLASELARRIPTAPLAGRAGQAVAFVGSSGAGKTRAIARLAAAYGAANHVPVACVTLQDSGSDGLLATALAPFGIAVHAAPDAPRALDRITALRRQALVLVDTPGVSPGDRDAVERLGSTLQLLELDQVALCLPVVLAAPIARRVLRAMRPLGPTVLVATHADEADLLGGVVAVAIDRRVPLAYVSAGAGRGSIVGADAHLIATELTAAATREPPAARRAPERIVPRAVAAPSTPLPSLDRDETMGGPKPTVDVAAGPGHLAAPWVVASLRTPKRRT